MDLKYSAANSRCMQKQRYRRVDSMRGPVKSNYNFSQKFQRTTDFDRPTRDSTIYSTPIDGGYGENNNSSAGSKKRDMKYLGKETSKFSQDDFKKDLW